MGLDNDDKDMSGWDYIEFIAEMVIIGALVTYFVFMLIEVSAR